MSRLLRDVYQPITKKMAPADLLKEFALYIGDTMDRKHEVLSFLDQFIAENALHEAGPEVSLVLNYPEILRVAGAVADSAIENPSNSVIEEKKDTQIAPDTISVAIKIKDALELLKEKHENGFSKDQNTRL